MYIYITYAFSITYTEIGLRPPVNLRESVLFCETNISVPDSVGSVKQIFSFQI